jgi:hypothetical protein
MADNNPPKSDCQKKNARDLKNTYAQLYDTMGNEMAQDSLARAGIATRDFAVEKAGSDKAYKDGKLAREGVAVRDFAREALEKKK